MRKVSYGINPDSSFLSKGLQFAKAVTAQTPASLISSGLKEEVEGKDIYQLMQERDALLKGSQSFDEIREQFLAISYRLNQLAENNTILKKSLDEHKQILSLAKDKISAIKGEIELSSSDYSTEALGEKQVNNFNFKFKMKGWKEDLVFRVEDRDDLGFEQELHSHPVAKYFANDVALFMMQFKSEDNKEIEYKPVVLSQFANQGSLLDVARILKGESQQKIAAITRFYFNQINDFCIKLKEAGAYHPDIKLSNFLLHNHKLLVSDRKTFVRSPKPLASGLRCSPRYAPPQYLACLDRDCEDYIPKAYSTRIDAEQLMSYQLGKALKEFLILTQLEKIPAENRAHDNVLAHFQKPNRAITNLSILVEELTRYEEGKRLTIEQFQRLLPFCNHQIDDFYKHLEKELPSNVLGIGRELEEINRLLHSHQLKGTNFLEQANIVFAAVSERAPREPRLNRIAEKLAISCYQNYSKRYFSQISQEIETTLLAKDWESASWWRQIFHTLSFGFFRVDRIAKAGEIKIQLDYNDQVFRTHFIQFEFLPAEELDSLGITQGNNLKNYFIKHLDEIRALNSASSEEEEIEAPESQKAHIKTSTPPKKRKKHTEELLSTETIVVKHNEGVKQESATSVPPVSVDPVIPPLEIEKKPQSKEKSQHKKTPSVSLAENQRFFAKLEKGYNVNEPDKRSIRRVDSTIFRGERKSRRPGVQEIFEPPLINEKPSELECTANDLSH